MRRDNLITIRNFAGINRKDGGEKVRDNQFFMAQNWFHPVKGLWYKRYGTTEETPVANFYGASRVTGVHRHYNPNKEKITLYHCDPDSSNFPDPTDDLVLTEISGGDIFSELAIVETMRFCYTWVGLGRESGYNTRHRAGYLNTFPTPKNAWDQPAHQSITVSDVTKGVRVTVPAFPSGVRSANIYAARGANSQMTFVGCVTQSGGSFDLKHFIADFTSDGDAIGNISAVGSTGGSLKPGAYYISIAWITDGRTKDGDGLYLNFYPKIVSTSKLCVVGTDQSSIIVGHDLAESVNGARACYVFIGTKPATEAPMMWVGNLKSSEQLTITSIPKNSNAQCHNSLEGGSDARFFNSLAFLGRDTHFNARFGFVLAKNESGAFYEILPSRNLIPLALGAADPIYGNSTSFWFYLGYIRTNSDNTAGVPVDFGDVNRTIYDPQFAYFNGLSYFVNGTDIPWQTDGYCLGQITRKPGTLLPPYPRFISVFQNSLLVAGAEAKNQVFACNALDPQNWAVGGTGTAKRFVAIGDLFGDEVTALSIFSFSPDAVNNPRNYFLAFKKHGIWMKDTFPDPTTGIGSPMEQLSGRVGCIAHRTIVQTPLGVVFLGSDGEVYLIRGSGEPLKMGTAVQPILDHLKSNDELMQKATAVFHDNHYKLSYPSSSASTYNDAQLWADLRTSQGDPIEWTGPHIGVSVGAQIVLVGESDDLSRVGCRADALGVLKLDDTSVMQDLGVSYSSILESKLYRFKDEGHLKRIMGAIFDAFYDPAYTHDILFQCFADEFYQQVNKALSNGAAIWDSSSYDADSWGGGQFMGIPCPLSSSNLVGRTFKYRFVHSNPAQFILASTSLLVRPERRLVI